MGKRNVKWSERTYLRFLRNGRGKGDLAAYKPWITVHDFPSLGKVVRIKGLTTGRIHHLLSQLEKYFFWELDNDPLVTDIKEQFPLPLSETLMIAANLDIKHPIINDFPYVVTTDFFYCKNGEWYAVTVKPSEKLKEKRVREKFEIERLYWEKHNISWKIVTEKELSITTASNIQWLHTGEPFEKLVTSKTMQKKLEGVFLELYEDKSIPFMLILDSLEEACSLCSGTIIQLFKKMILEEKIHCDLRKPIHTYEPRNLFA